MSVKVLGFPWDEMSSYLRGPAEAPARIRQVMASGSSNLCSEDGLDLAASEDFEVLGDQPIEAGEQAVAQIEATVREFLGRGHRLLSLGGDHAITYPILRAYGRKFPQLSILHFDAHPDLYEDFEGNRLSHACPFARIMEEGLAHRLVQVGIRTINAHQQAQIERYGVEVIEARKVERHMHMEFSGPVYLSFDLDGIDPAEAPGVSHHEPGGISLRQALDIIQKIKAPLVGADIVELNPKRDDHERTAALAVKLLKEIGARMLTTPLSKVEAEN